MGTVDPAAAIVLGLLTLGIIAYAAYLKIGIRRLDRIIAEKEAAMNAPDQPSSPAR